MYQPTKILVSGQPVTVRPYTEKLRSLLESVQRQIQDYTDENKDLMYDDMPILDKATFWKMKADILWDHGFGIEFFMSDDFELELLAESERRFYEHANKSIELAEEYFGTAQNFQGNTSMSGIGKKMIWTKKMGSYRYKAYILAGFDPVRADAIFDMPADAIAAAYVSKMCYEYSEPKNRPTR